MSSKSLCVFCLFSLFSYVLSEEVIVDTTHGKVAGKVFKTLFKQSEYYGFLGIPYAAPPVKDLRFKPPKPIPPWDNVLSATKETPACLQFNTNVKKGQPLGHFGVEDCLYLDVFTPAVDGDKRPLLVFLYNEQFKHSYNKTKDYAPDFFIDENVVVATITHRLSVFGFLSLEDDILPGNAGLRDIVAALEWLRDNIERFGGDPHRITLMGAQGGAAAVDLLIHSKARNLFNSAILQSDTALAPLYLQDKARVRAFKLGELLEISTGNGQKLLKELSDIPAGDLLEKEFSAVPQDYCKEQQRGLLPFGPIVENDPNGLVTEYPENTKRMDIPIMIGFNSREGLESSLQYLIEKRYLSFVEKDFVLIVPKRLNLRFNPFHDSYYKAVDDIKTYYFPKGKVTINSVPDYVTYMGDVLTIPIDYAVKHYSNISSSKVYYYHFDYFSGLNENKNNLMKLSTVEDGTWGAATGDELCYLFKCPDLKAKYLQFNKSMSEEIVIQKSLVKMWTNFIKYGNPTPDDKSSEGVKWTPYNIETKEYLHIGRKLVVRKDLNKERFGFWEKFLKKWESNAVDGVVIDKKNINDEL